jgi:hypothetical protein
MAGKTTSLMPLLVDIPRVSLRNHVPNPLPQAFLSFCPTGALACPFHFGPLNVIHTLELDLADPAQLDVCPHRAIGFGGQCAPTVVPKHIVTRADSPLFPEQVPQVFFQCLPPTD